MARSHTIEPKMTHAEAVAAFDRWLTEQERDGRQGERIVSVNLGAGGTICSMKAMTEMARFTRLRAATRNENA